ncbi:MAG: hypothetical protein NXI01_07460 [Gammaproteobacteria bacterium]|nr:hypothetical protein [Gammaproteobacteria bacterium]
MLVYASQDIERAQHEADSHFSELVELCGTEKKAKLSFISDRFDAVIVPWLEKKGVDGNLIQKFRKDMINSYAKILNRVQANPIIDINVVFRSSIRSILQTIVDTQAIPQPPQTRVPGFQP